MTRLSKRMKKIRETVQPNTVLNTLEAFETLKKLSGVKFTESVDVSIQLGVDVKKSEQQVRGSTLLPHGSGRAVKVAVMTKGAPAEAAQKAGADVVGFDDLAQTIQSGKMDFDILIASPDAMPLVGKLGPILGPRGLMPNPKLGTVTADVATAVKNAKKGQIHYKTDKAGIVHCRIGSVQFSAEALKANLDALISDLKRLKPTTSKGIYLQKVTASTTMGPGILISRGSLLGEE